jgi:hypothetical protein
VTRGRVYREAALGNEIQHSSQLGSTRQHVVAKTVEKHKHTRGCNKISNSPRNDMVYQDAIESKWHGMGPAQCASRVLFQQQRHPQIAPQTFRHNPMAQSRPNLPSLNASPWNPLSKIVSYKNCGACLDMEETREHLLSFPSRGVLSLENFHSWCGCSLFSNCKIGTSAT